MNNIDKIVNLGQIFTPEIVVNRMISLKRNFGTVLEPSAGNGVFLKKLPEAVGIELDKEICLSNCLNVDFFDYDINNKFDTIIGNPPYVAYKEILSSTKHKLNLELFDKRTNLYTFFIAKCLEHLNQGGELIFITPRDFIKATSCINLNKLLAKHGTITHFYDLGDEIIFKGHAPNCAIWRFEKGNFSYLTETNDGLRNFLCVNGQICFTKEKYSIPFQDIFYVKVGAVSGLDEIFQSQNGNEEFVCSYTRKNNKTKRMFYNIKNSYLETNKEKLLNRKLRKFDETNWWKWGRDQYKTNDKRVYVNCKTRQSNPFFIHSCRNFDGAILGIFIKKSALSEQTAADLLNSVNWEELGFKCGGRFLFTQKSLENIILPEKIFSQYV